MIENIKAKMGLLRVKPEGNKLRIYVGNNHWTSSFKNQETSVLTAKMTPLAAIRGGSYNRNSGTPGIQHNNGVYYVGKHDYIDYDHFDGKPTLKEGEFQNGCIRPYIQFESEKDFKHYTASRVKENGLELVTFGTYPTCPVDIGIIDYLDFCLNQKTLEKAESFYTLPSENFRFTSKENERLLKQYQVYKYFSLRLIKVIFWHIGIKVRDDLAIETHMQAGERYSKYFMWLKEQPIWWFVDDQNLALISKECLLAGINYENIDSFLNEHMLRDLLKMSNEEKLETEIRNATAEKEALLHIIKNNISDLRNACEILGEPLDRFELPFDQNIKGDGIQFVFKKQK